MNALSKRNVNSLICLTEEGVETLFHLGREKLIKGVSCFVERPLEAKKLPIVTSFIKADIKKILSFKPDLVLGFSDIQKDIARDLIEAGSNVLISNQRSIDEILDWIYRLSLLVDAKEEGIKFITKLEDKIHEIKKIAKSFTYRPRVYFEEWDEPMITAIKWVSECLDLCGAENIFEDLSNGAMARDRFVKTEQVIKRDPEIIFLCWCGKKADINSVKKRKGWEEISAVQNDQIFELDPAIFLQPGPAPILDGLNVILSYIQALNIDKN